ncbi:ABC transporter permease [Novosphingobium sp. ZN18A2]|uniref:ABC transporter permease n=1 Tax=Novosphingobium sp. ZN18A2 TaxID=3079861 RepID=UPI0030CE2ED8
MWQRIGAMVFKEVRQMARDPGTLAMMFFFPIMQLVIFGFAINNDPRHLPLAVEVSDHSQYSRSIVAALRNTTYFEVTQVPGGYGDGDRLIAEGKAQFLLTIPPHFARDLVRGDRPQLLLTADATDPAATGPAVAAVGEAVTHALGHDLAGPLARLMPAQAPVDVVLHKSYNPEGITSHNTVPGLLAIILSMTMVVLTAMSVTREVEQGTMENLLATPLRPIEVMIGKIIPYIVMGLVQTIVVLIFAATVFQVPFEGSLALLFAVTLLYIVVSLALGFTISTVAKSQVQAMQISIFYVMPSVLLSGFAFPFRGMPVIVQYLAEILPPTHYIVLVRGIMLKGWNLTLALPQIGVLALMLAVLTFIAVRRYQDTIA